MAHGINYIVGDLLPTTKESETLGQPTDAVHAISVGSVTLAAL